MIFWYILIGVVVVVTVYLAAVMPRMFFKAPREAFLNQYFAHRGYHNQKLQIPENSTKAFERAIENGFGIELDVQLTKDRIPVVFHDKSLLRACGIDIKVKELTYKEIEQYLLFQTSEKIPKFTDVLEQIQGKVPLLVEFKVQWDAVPTCSIVDQVLRQYQGQYAVQSFSPLVLMWYRKHRPNILRGQLSTNFKEEKIEGNPKVNFMLQHLLFNFLTKPDFISYDYKYRNNLSFQIATKCFGALAFGWTIKDEKVLAGSINDFNCYIFERFHPNLHSSKVEKAPNL